MRAAPDEVSSAEIRTHAEQEVQSLLEDRGLVGKACAVAFLSFDSPESFIAAGDTDGHLTPLIGFLPLPLRGAALLETIAAIDENGPRLVSNYSITFAEDAERLAGFTPGIEIDETPALAWLLAASSLVLGLDETDVTRALEPSAGTVGLDTFVIEVGGCYVLDGRRLLRSLMSYRIGGVPTIDLARSVFESLGAFAADAIVRMLRDWRAAAIVCAGDLFAGNAILRERARRGLAGAGLPVLDQAAVRQPEEAGAPSPARLDDPPLVPVRLRAPRTSTMRG